MALLALDGHHLDGALTGGLHWNEPAFRFNSNRRIVRFLALTLHMDWRWETLLA